MSLLFLALLVGAVLNPGVSSHIQLDHVAITRFQPRRLFADPLGYEVLVELANHSNMPKDCRLELTLDGQLVDWKPLTLAANSVETHILHGSTEKGGVLRASVDITDALVADNTAWANLPSRNRQKIVLRGEENFFLARALQSQQSVDLLSAGEIPQTGETVFIYHQTVPERLPEGNALLVDPRNDCELFTVGKPLESPLVGQTNNDSPLMRFVQLENTLITGVREIRFTENTAKPNILAATAEGHPFFFQWDNGNRGKITVLSADLRLSGLPLRTAFPIMVTNVLDSFRSEGAKLEQAMQDGDISENDLHDERILKNVHKLQIGFLLTLFALLLTMFDWVLYHRRWI